MPDLPRFSVHLFIALLIQLPLQGCVSTRSDPSTVVDVSSGQTAKAGRSTQVAENDEDNDGPSLISRLFGRGGDSDGDGIADDVDKCPDDPEDRDGFADDDGCPDPDNDHDGVLDINDMCPNLPETINGFQDEDGCPDANIDRAKLAFREGATAYAQGDFAAARRFFEEANNLEPNDVLLFNIAQSAEKQGDHPYACQTYRRWQTTPAGSKSTNRIPALDSCP